MLFISYYELSENSPVANNLAGAQKIMGAGLYPVEGVKMIRWDATADGWGILVFESDSAEAVLRTSQVWRTAIPGFFKSIKTSPAMTVQEAIGVSTQIAQALGGK